MSRYFLEVSYHGKEYGGFQIQQNVRTIQSEVERAFQIFFKQPVALTGSSRTDAGVHALQNFFHFDFDRNIESRSVYNLNAILPEDIVIRNLKPVPDDSHSRFDASSREYRYYLYTNKNPFLKDRAYFYPYTLNLDLLEEAAGILTTYSDFTSFSKRNTQVKTFLCNIMVSEWHTTEDGLYYYVKANRFLRGMVRALVGTMLQVGRGKTSIEGFRQIIESRNCTLADFSVPAHGLFLCKVNYPY